MIEITYKWDDQPGVSCVSYYVPRHKEQVRIDFPEAGINPPVSGYVSDIEWDHQGQLQRVTVTLAHVYEDRR